MTEDSRETRSQPGDSDEQNASSQSRGNREGDPDETIAPGDLPHHSPHELDVDWDDRDAQTPILATLVTPDMQRSEPVRVGSPFAVDPQPLVIDRPIEVLIDGGPLRYTAMGAVAAAAMVLAFAAAAAWWFPAGGTMIAALGCVLSIFGLYSNYRYTAGCLLLLHLALFVVSYGRSIG